MMLKSVGAVVVLGVVGIVVASCMAAAPEADTMAKPGLGPSEEAAAQEATDEATADDESTGEARQEVEFAFKTTIPADADGGGWQEAHVRVAYADWRVSPVKYWSCAYIIGMPLRLGPTPTNPQAK